MSGGWAHHRREAGKRRTLAPGATRKGVTITDMPAAKPAIERPHIKGLPGPTYDGDEDHEPGGGTWTPLTTR
jgi:hypothetical protein